MFQTTNQPIDIHRKPQEDSDDFKWIILKLSGELPKFRFVNHKKRCKTHFSLRTHYDDFSVMIFNDVPEFSMMSTFRFFKLRDIIENHGTSLCRKEMFEHRKTPSKEWAIILSRSFFDLFEEAFENSQNIPKLERGQGQPLQSPGQKFLVCGLEIVN